MKKIFKTMVMAVLVSAILAAGAGLALADAPLAQVSVQPQVMHEVGRQDFVLTNPNAVGDVTFTWTGGGGSGGPTTLAAGQSTTISVPTSVGNTVLLTITHTAGATGTKRVQGGYQYYVYESYKIDGGADLRNPVNTVVKANQPKTLSPARLIEKDGVQYEYWYTEGGIQVAGNQYSGNRDYVHVYRKYVPKPYDITIELMELGDNTTPLKTETRRVESGASVTYDVPNRVDVGRNVYRVCSEQSGQVTHQYGNQMTTYRFYYEKMPEPPTSAYLITVRYLNEGGKIIASEQVEVPLNTDINYNVKQTLYDANGNRYVLKAGEATVIHHDFIDSSSRMKYVQCEMANLRPTTPYDVTIEYKDALTHEVLYSEVKHMALDGQVAHDAPMSYTDANNGVRYLIAGGQNRSVRLNFADGVTVATLYYNNENATPVDPYNVTIQLVDGETNTLMGSATVEVPVGGEALYQADATMTYGGETYMLSRWSNAQIRHSFENERRVYTLFYYTPGAIDEEPEPGPGPVIVDGDDDDGADDADLGIDQDALNNGVGGDFRDDTQDALGDGNKDDDKDNDADLVNKDALGNGKGGGEEKKSASNSASPWLWLLTLIPVGAVGVVLGVKAKKSNSN